MGVQSLGQSKMEGGGREKVVTNCGKRYLLCWILCMKSETLMVTKVTEPKFFGEFTFFLK